MKSLITVLVALLCLFISPATTIGGWPKPWEVSNEEMLINTGQPYFYGDKFNFGDSKIWKCTYNNGSGAAISISYPSPPQPPSRKPPTPSTPPPTPKMSPPPPQPSPPRPAPKKSPPPPKPSLPPPKPSPTRPTPKKSPPPPKPSPPPTPKTYPPPPKPSPPRPTPKKSSPPPKPSLPPPKPSPPRPTPKKYPPPPKPSILPPKPSPPRPTPKESPPPPKASPSIGHSPPTPKISSPPPKKSTPSPSPPPESTQEPTTPSNPKNHYQNQNPWGHFISCMSDFGPSAICKQQMEVSYYTGRFRVSDYCCNLIVNMRNECTDVILGFYTDPFFVPLIRCTCHVKN